jgi:hypothetical protein
MTLSENIPAARFMAVVWNDSALTLLGRTRRLILTGELRLVGACSRFALATIAASGSSLHASNAVIVPQAAGVIDAGRH